MKQFTKLGLTTVLAGTIWALPAIGIFGDAVVKAQNVNSNNTDLSPSSIDLQQVQQLIKQNPALVEQAQQLLLQNPELVLMLVQQLMETNPQLLEQIQNNPQLVQQVGKQSQQIIQLLRDNPQLVQQLQQIMQNSRQRR